MSAENRISQSRFECVRCGYKENADLNAARNILAAGHAVLACGESAQSGLSTKQEPAEVTHALHGRSRSTRMSMGLGIRRAQENEDVNGP